MRSTSRILLGLATLGAFALVVAFQCADSFPVAAGSPSEPAAAPPPVEITRYWKGNLHTHSLWSDGDDFPEMIADWYKQHGYQFLALTEHNIIAEGNKWVDAAANATRTTAIEKYVNRFGARWVDFRPAAGGKREVRLKPLAEYRTLLEEPGRFLFVPAEEISHSYAKRPVHINGINLRDPIKPVDGKDMIETIAVNLRQVGEQSRKTSRAMIAFLNHPNFGWGVRAEEMLAVEELKFFEVFNGHPSVRNYGDDLHASCERVWDVALALRLGKYSLPVVYGMATDDAHGYHAYGLGKVNPGRGWVMVKSRHLTAESLVRGLESGDFYASTGVLFDEIRREGDELRLTIHAEPGVSYTTRFIATLKETDLTRKAKLDKDGLELPVTGDYSPEIGKVVAESISPSPRYTLTGKELYVRAKVVSTRAHPNPYAKGDVEVAWTQPVVP